MKVGEQYDTPPCECLNCHRQIDMASGVGHSNGPSPGDITICMYCGHLMAFTDDMTLREPTSAELDMVAGDERVLAVQKARGYVMRNKT